MTGFLGKLNIYQRLVLNIFQRSSSTPINEILASVGGSDRAYDKTWDRARRPTTRRLPTSYRSLE